MKYFFLIIVSINAFAVQKDSLSGKMRYKTFFGQCPSKIVGTLTLNLVKKYEETQSLKAVKDYIVNTDMKDRYYLSHYEIKADPKSNLLKFSYNCPKPLMKVQVFKDDSKETYTGILVENGKIFDSTYEILLRSEGKIEHDLPSFAIPVDELKNNVHEHMANLMNNLGYAFRTKISEMIINGESDLIVILSVNNRPTSVFMGQDQWENKFEKLIKIIDYMSEKKKIPSIINITNSKKVVVKFSDNI